MVDLRKNVMNQFQKQAINNVKENLGIETNDNSQISSNNNNQSPISWHNYNYPPVLKILHYSTDQLRQPFVGLAKRMHACAILILVNTLINLLNVIIEIATDCEAIPNIIILYSLLNVPIFTFCALFSFSQGYYAICQGPGHKRKFCFYQITQVILVIAWFVFSIIKAGPFDGWTKIGVLSECNLGFSIFLAVVQNLIYLTAIALGIYCLIRARQYYGETPFLNESLPNQTVEDERNNNQKGIKNKRRNQDLSDNEI
eukprot:403373235